MLFKNLLWVAIGGALGSISRYLGQRFLSQSFPQSFPVGTFTVNILGCFLIGILYGLSNKYQYFTPEFRLLMMTGFCGGFTTFSAFTLEGMQLLNQQRFLIFTLYFVLSVFIGLIATFMGNWIIE
ncbi:MAG: fluoride efflux transporter CrcB [Flavitalea sp.]